jgi:hypothetical protein
MLTAGIDTATAVDCDATADDESSYENDTVAGGDTSSDAAADDGPGDDGAPLFDAIALVGDGS